MINKIYKKMHKNKMQMYKYAKFVLSKIVFL